MDDQLKKLHIPEKVIGESDENVLIHERYCGHVLLS